MCDTTKTKQKARGQRMSSPLEPPGTRHTDRGDEAERAPKRKPKPWAPFGGWEKRNALRGKAGKKSIPEFHNPGRISFLERYL